MPPDGLPQLLQVIGQHRRPVCLAHRSTQLFNSRVRRRRRQLDPPYPAATASYDRTTGGAVDHAQHRIDPTRYIVLECVALAESSNSMSHCEKEKANAVANLPRLPP